MSRVGNSVIHMPSILKIASSPLEYLRKGLSLAWWKRRAELNSRLRPMRKEAHDSLRLLFALKGRGWAGAKKHRDDGLRKIIEYAGTHCAYYKNLFAAHGVAAGDLSEFQNLPLLDKDLIRKNRESLVSDQIELLPYYGMNTGGSTGEPLDFIVSHLAGYIDTGHQEFVFRDTMGYVPGDVVVAFDGSSVPEESLRKECYWVKTADTDLPYGRLSYSSFYLDGTTFPRYLSHFLKVKPAIIRGYPSVISDFANRILANNVEIPFTVKGIQLTAENGYKWQVETIEAAFKSKVFFQYGHSEVSVYAYTERGSQEYICSPLYGFTEIIAVDGRPAEVGQVGEIVVTGFHNRAMPLIRYRTGDMAVFGGDDDGVVRFTEILGRSQDFVISNTGAKVPLTPIVFGQHYKAFANIQKWQLRQDFPGRVTVKIIKAPAYSSKDEAEVRFKFKELGGVDISVEYVDEIPLTQRGKYQFIVQNLRI